MEESEKYNFDEIHFKRILSLIPNHIAEAQYTFNDSTKCQELFIKLKDPLNIAKEIQEKIYSYPNVGDIIPIDIKRPDKPKNINVKIAPEKRITLDDEGIVVPDPDSEEVREVASKTNTSQDVTKKVLSKQRQNEM